MFSRLYNSARAIFTESAPTQREQAARIDERLRAETMVTTRHTNSQAPEVNEVEEEDSINVYVPTSSSKRRRKSVKGMSSSDEDAAEYVPPSSRKRKRLPVRAKDVENSDPGKTRLVVEIPAKKISPEPDHGHEVAAEEEEEDTNAQNGEHYAADAETIKPTKHRRFGSEEVEGEFFSTAREGVNNKENATPKSIEDHRVVEDSEGSEDSDDDAPEAVGIQEAAKNLKLKDQEAARVVKDQLSESRKKRKDRDETLKKQAESSKKRKLEADITGATKPVKRSHKEDDKVKATEPDADKNHVVEESGFQKGTPKTLSLSSKRALPNVLPAEYLEETEPQDLLPFDQFLIKKAKKTKFHLSAEKEPRDRRIGSTTYRVTKTSSTNLAPKLSSHARNTKESWLQGRSGKNLGTNRTPFSKGFFKK